MVKNESNNQIGDIFGQKGVCDYTDKINDKDYREERSEQSTVIGILCPYPQVNSFSRIVKSTLFMDIKG